MSLLESAEPTPTPTSILVQWTAEIRGNLVQVLWSDGEWDGDVEVLERLGHLPDDGAADTLEKARLVVANVLLDPLERVVMQGDR